MSKERFIVAKKITGIIIPNTVKTLKYECLECLYLKEPLIIPRSVTKIESNFLDSWYSKALIFCGTKEPELVEYKHEGRWISALFTGNVIVPKNYEKDTFCLKNVAKTATKECPIKLHTYLQKKNELIILSFILTFVLNY